MAQNAKNLQQTVPREDERGFAAAGHLLGAIPLWGFFFLALIWVYFKERSRQVVFQIQQAMLFQMVFLAVAVFALAIYLLLMPVHVLNAGLADFLYKANTFLLVSIYIVYACVCVAAMAFTLIGKPFLYPMVGRRILESGGTKSMPEV